MCNDSPFAVSVLRKRRFAKHLGKIYRKENDVCLKFLCPRVVIRRFPVVELLFSVFGKFVRASSFHFSSFRLSLPLALCARVHLRDL